jgi:site-specific DNA-cytosine methylase
VNARPPTIAVLDLFAGGGGTSTGLLSLGLDVLALEFNPDAAAVHEACAGPCIVADLRDVSAWLPRVLAWLAGRPLRVWASPPCQAFSAAGKRLGAADERNGWPWLWDAIDALRAAGVEVVSVTCENVAGMLHHLSRAECDHGLKPNPDACPGCYFAAVVVPECVRRFAVVRWTVLDAVDYGVPQHRERVILHGGPVAVRWPMATHHPIGGVLRPWWRTVRDALGHAVVGGGSRGHGVAEWRPRELGDEPCATVSGFGSTGGLYVRTEQTGARGVSADEPAPTTGTVGNLYRHNGDPGARVAGDRLVHDSTKHPAWTPDAPAGTVRAMDGAQYLADGPCTTVTATEGRGCATDTRRASRTLGRRATPEECALLQAWPEVIPALTAASTVEARYRVVGNAVPPPLAAAVFRAVLA